MMLMIIITRCFIMNKANFHKNLNIRISLGNTKLGTIPQFNLTPVKSCLNCSECKKYCYALKSYRQYPDTRTAWDKNLHVCSNDLDTFKHEMRDFLTIYSPKYFRLHAAGDFFNQDYIDAWFKIIKEFPDITFLAYTKSYNNRSENTYLKFNNIPKNLKLYFSIEQDNKLPKQKPKHVKYAYIETDKRINNSFVCPATIADHTKITCNKCLRCFKGNKNVVFNLH